MPESVYRDWTSLSTTLANIEDSGESPAQEQSEYKKGRRRHWPNEQPRDKAFSTPGQLEGETVVGSLSFSLLSRDCSSPFLSYSFRPNSSSSSFHGLLCTSEKEVQKASSLSEGKNTLYCQHSFHLRTCTNCATRIRQKHPRSYIGYILLFVFISFNILIKKENIVIDNFNSEKRF